MAASTHDGNYQLFLALLRQARLRAGITQETLGHRLGNTQTFISKAERGERRIDLVEFVEICDSMGVNALEVFEAYLAARSTNSAPKSQARRGRARTKSKI